MIPIKINVNSITQFKLCYSQYITFRVAYSLVHSSTHLPHTHTNSHKYKCTDGHSYWLQFVNYSMKLTENEEETRFQCIDLQRKKRQWNIYTYTDI